MTPLLFMLLSVLVSQAFAGKQKLAFVSPSNMKYPKSCVAATDKATPITQLKEPRDTVMSPSLYHELLSTKHPDHEYDPDHNKSLLEKGLEKISQVLPRSIVKDKQTRQAQRKRQLQRKAFGKEMKRHLKETPLPFRLFGNAMISGANGMMQKEGRKVEKYLRQSQRLLNADKKAVELMGKPIVAGNILSQDSSTTTLNGKKTVRIHAVFEVSGSNQKGVVSMIGDKHKVVSLQLKSAEGKIFVKT